MTDNDHWLVNIVLKQEDSALKMWTEPIMVTRASRRPECSPTGSWSRSPRASRAAKLALKRGDQT